MKKYYFIIYWFVFVQSIITVYAQYEAKLGLGIAKPELLESNSGFGGQLDGAYYINTYFSSGLGVHWYYLSYKLENNITDQSNYFFYLINVSHYIPIDKSKLYLTIATGLYVEYYRSSLGDRYTDKYWGFSPQLGWLYPFSKKISMDIDFKSNFYTYFKDLSGQLHPAYNRDWDKLFSLNIGLAYKFKS